MPWVGFEPTISAGERPKTYALDRTATGTGTKVDLQDCKLETSTQNVPIANWKPQRRMYQLAHRVYLFT